VQSLDSAAQLLLCHGLRTTQAHEITPSLLEVVGKSHRVRWYPPLGSTRQESNTQSPGPRHRDMPWDLYGAHVSTATRAQQPLVVWRCQASTKRARGRRCGLCKPELYELCARPISYALPTKWQHIYCRLDIYPRGRKDALRHPVVGASCPAWAWRCPLLVLLSRTQEL